MTSLIDRESHMNFQGGFQEELSLDRASLEYSGSGMGDLRPAALSVISENADNVLDLRYQSYEILAGKPPIANLPHTYADNKETQTLVVTLKDCEQNIAVDLYYTAFQSYNVITRWAVIKNEGSKSTALTKAMSASLNLPSINMDFVHLHGAWAREFNLEKMPISHCTQSISSFKGASGHQHNPFAAFAAKDCTETNGEVYGVSLVYSGNFLIESDVDANEALRVNAGINDRAFKWNLAPGENFSTPEAVLVYSANGFGELSRSYHDLYRKHLCRGIWRDEPRPVLVNTWEAVYFDFDHERLMSVAKNAAELGIELFVLDDGWFGERYSTQARWVTGM
jgi:alpha-galactosidase